MLNAIQFQTYVFHVVLVNTISSIFQTQPLSIQNHFNHCILFLVLKLKLNFSWGEKLKLYELIGGEYQAFTSLLQSFGIIHKVSCPHTHEQNGVVEQKHRHIIKSGLTLLAQASLPLKY